jgi:hypothetical protein
MHKIQKTSHFLYLFFKVLYWALPTLTIYLILFHLPTVLNLGGWSSIISEAQVQNSADFSLSHRFIILAIQFLPLSITLFIFNRLARLFHLYEQGILFDCANIKLIKSISLYMILGEFIQIIYQPLITVAFTFTNQPGHRFASLSFGTTNISTLITGFIILVAAWVVKEAHMLKTEVQLTI